MPGRRRIDSDDDDEMEITGSKKRRLEFGKGSITRVRVKNFMTYGLAEFTPGSRLNLVLGPNGSGKSSLVSAICIGLAGSAKLLGRADNLRDFVLRGEETGTIEIWLRTATVGKDTRVTRIINRSTNNSNWRIDGHPKIMGDVQLLVRNLGIQLDNLCQFMPQDRVAEFARLKPCELLEETQKAIGDATLNDLHQALIKGRKDFVAQETTANTWQEELNKLEKANDSLKRDVSRFEHKADLEQQIEELRGRGAWLEHDDLKASIKTIEVNHKKAQNGLKSLQEQYRREDQPLKDKETRMKAAEKEAEKQDRQFSNTRRDIESIHDNLEKKTDEMKDRQNAIDNAEEAFQTREEEIAKAEKHLEDAQTALKKYTDDVAQNKGPDHSQNIRQLNRHRNDKKQELTRLRADRASVVESRSDLENEMHELKGQLNSFEDVKRQRLRILEDSDGQNKGITALVDWLKEPENRSIFRGPVYGPIALEVNVEDNLHCKFLEQLCPRNIWSRFIVCFNEDQDELYKRATHFCKGFKPTITVYGGNSEQEVQHPLGEASQYAARHVTHTADQLFNAPQVVKLTMCDECQLSTAYCGKEALDARKFLEDFPNIKRLLTPESSYMKTVSKYNTAAQAISVRSIADSKILKKNTSKSEEIEKRRIEASIEQKEQEHESMRSRLMGLEEQIQAESNEDSNLGKEIKKLEAEMKAAKIKRTNLQQNVRAAESRLNTKRSETDPREKIPEHRRDIETLKQNITAWIAELVNLYKEALQFQRKRVISSAIHTELKAQVSNLESRRKENSKKEAEFKKQINLLKDKMKEEQKNLQKLKQDAEALTGPMTDVMKAKMEKLPANIDAIANEISMKQTEIDAIHLANPRAMAEYTARRLEIEDLQKRLKNQKTEVERMRVHLEQIRDEWLPELQKTVGLINLKFEECFKKIGCVGEVMLYEEKSPLSVLDDFEKFAIHIRVRYRDGESLQLLDQHRQSGGERSVATILYLISLQGVTVCPFRVVDEINQGMDPINERKCFMQLVEAACQPNTPQCFLLTPKLLPNLPYSEYITLLQINNGSLIKDAAKDFEKGMLVGSRPIVYAH